MRKPKGLGIREIAKRTNLNISTVSRALNHSFLVSRETTELVLKVAYEMGYRRETPRKNIIVLLPIVKHELAWYSLNLMNALSSTLQKHGYLWEFINADQTAIIPERAAAGIISFDYAGTTIHDLSKDCQLPIVCINESPSHFNNVYSAISDASSAITLAMRCLCDFGHRKIAYINSSGDTFQGRNRRQAFLEETQKLHLSKGCSCVDGTREINHGIIQNLYENGITGIIADGESAGIKIFNSLNFCKIRIPQDISLITWELPFVSELMQPAITTVGQDFTKLAESALFILEQQIHNEKPSSDIMVPYQLFLRNSVSLPRP